MLVPGLSAAQLEGLARDNHEKKAHKVSRRDLPFVISQVTISTCIKMAKVRPKDYSGPRCGLGHQPIKVKWSCSVLGSVQGISGPTQPSGRVLCSKLAAHSYVPLNTVLY